MPLARRLLMGLREKLLIMEILLLLSSHTTLPHLPTQAAELLFTYHCPITSLLLNAAERQTHKILRANKS